MKIQCACGAKYAFDVTPEMAENPVRFICQNCGLDASDYVNGLIREELARGLYSAPPPPPADAPPAAAPVYVATPHLRIASAAGSASSPAPETAAGAAAPQLCLRHGGEVCTQRCVVCQKPICPKCMEHFGYVCSPLCKAKAEAKKIQVPVYEGQKWVVEAQYWQKVGRIAGAIGAAVAVLLGVWFWYAWFGSVPHPVFSVRFESSALAGQSQLCGKNQIVFLHGNTLARYNIKTKKEVWSHPMIDPQLIKDAIARASADSDAVAALASLSGHMNMAEVVEQEMESGFQLQVAGSNVWVSSPGKFTHFDWDTGKVLQEVPLTFGMGEMIPQGNELLMMGEGGTSQQTVTYLNLATGELRTEEIGRPEKPAVASATNASGKIVVASARRSGGSPSAGLPLQPGATAGKPLDPGKVAAQAQNLPLPAKIALPALLANSMHQERIMQEADDGESDGSSRAWQNALASRFFENPWIKGVHSFIPSEYGSLQLGVRIIQTNIVTRDAMKAPPKKSVLDSGNLNVTKTADVANEILNEMQRNRGGSTVSEDESRYQVTIHRPDSAETDDWTGEVVGPPALFSLKTVNVLTSGKIVTVFDKTNKKLWQATLAYSVPAGAGILENEGAFNTGKSRYGDGPCVEHGNTLYVFDQAVLTAFDLTTGNARWRLPSVGIAGVFFDDKGKLYVNSTTASPENIKFSRQIDISQKTDAVFLKVDPQTGRILWKAEPGNFISYLAGKFIYTYYVNYGGDDSGMADLAGITPTPSFVRIRRINPRNGEIMWDYQQMRAPLNLQFSGNTIQLVFKKEVQVLKFLSL